jgi:hypothetical protein
MREWNPRLAIAKAKVAALVLLEVIAEFCFVVVARIAAVPITAYYRCLTWLNSRTKIR